MSTLKITTANFFAKNSCRKWQKNRVIRTICRKIYRFIMETGAKSYPYEDPDFANWPESDEDDTYSLISDSSNLVIRHSPSYINWLVKTRLHQQLKFPTPKARRPGEHAFDAKHWDEVLEYNGWKLSRHGPEFADVSSGVHYIGILPNEGEFGQLVWFIGNNLAYSRKDGAKYIKNWLVATYKNSEEHYGIPTSGEVKIIWYTKQ